MNKLQEALIDNSNVALDFYLEDVSIEDIRLHIEEIINKSICSTPQGELKMKIFQLLNDHD